MHIQLVDMVCDRLLMLILCAIPASSVGVTMQAIQQKTAVGDMASVQQEVDGVVQQLRLHVCYLSPQHIVAAI